MRLPELEVNSRDREFRHYSRDLRETIVMKYLFEGLSSRELDRTVLGLDSNKSKGYQSWAVLRHYGFGDGFKGIFSGMSVCRAMEEIPSDGRYDVLYDILSGYSDYGEGKIEDDGWARGFTRLRLVNTRVNQDKFRESILKAYNGSCCITGMDEPSLLRASHIKPWADSSETEKTDVRNGLCLNTLHDAAFDVGLMTVRYQDYTIRLSRRIEDHMSESVMTTISVSMMGWRYPFRTTTGLPVRSISSITWTASSKNVVQGAFSNWSCRIEWVLSTVHAASTIRIIFFDTHPYLWDPRHVPTGGDTIIYPWGPMTRPWSSSNTIVPSAAAATHPTSSPAGTRTGRMSRSTNASAGAGSPSPSRSSNTPPAEATFKPSSLLPVTSCPSK